MSDNITYTLTKLAKRATRPGQFQCGRCHQANQTHVYWFQAPNGNKVVVNQTALTGEGVAQGATVAVPAADIHQCFLPDVTGERTQRKAVPAPEAVPAPAPVPAPVPAPATADADVTALLAQLAQLLARPAIDADQVRAICEDIVRGMVFPVTTVVVRDGVTRQVPGLTHKSLGRVIAAASTGEHVMLVGPAGTGKSHMARQVAAALGVEFYTLSSSLTAQTGEAKFTGFVDANGTFHGTKVYDWAANPAGGVFCIDEIDNGNPNITGWWNAVLANREVTFPNGETFALTEKHLAVGTANTYGFGRTGDFVGRNPMDGATRNRFTFITITIDDALETALVHGTGAKADTAEKVLAYVRSLRKAADAEGVNVIASPRNSVRMAKLLSTDAYDWDMAVEDGLRAGIPDETWAKLTRAMKSAS